MKIIKLTALAAILGISSISTANARDSVNFSISVGVPGHYIAEPAYYEAPRAAYYAPRPVYSRRYEAVPVEYYYDRPRYEAVPVEYYYDRPRYYRHDEGYRGYRGHHRHHHRHHDEW